MTEDDARAWVVANFGADAANKLDLFATVLRDEATRQNLISVATITELWSRHLVDSAQLLLHAGDDWGSWCDIGSGAGLPGLVIAAITDRSVTLIEPRRLRAEFLLQAAEKLAISARVIVIARSSERVQLEKPADVISARAVAALPKLLQASHHLSNRNTLWLLPKGASAYSEVAQARASWHGTFHVKPSATSAEAGIVVASGVCPR